MADEQRIRYRVRGRSVKRTPLRPGKPLNRYSELRRSSALTRRTPVAPRNEKRLAKRKAEDYGGAYADLIRSLPCVACEADGKRQTWPTVAAHAAKTRGAGGKARDLVPLCWWHENEFHDIGRATFAQLYTLDLAGLAGRLYAEFHGEER